MMAAESQNERLAMALECLPAACGVPRPEAVTTAQLPEPNQCGEKRKSGEAPAKEGPAGKERAARTVPLRGTQTASTNDSVHPAREGMGGT